MHEEAETFRKEALSHPSQRGLLYGSREFKWPMIALKTSLDLGPARHALSQMVVSGEMIVFPPFVRPPPGKNTPKK